LLAKIGFTLRLDDADGILLDFVGVEFDQVTTDPPTRVHS
jgi:hypothetical protein